MANNNDKNLEKELDCELDNALRCPITYSFYKEPWLTNDRHTYEHRALKHYMTRTSKSPITKEELVQKNFKRFALVGEIIVDFVKVHPDLADDVYYFDASFNSNKEDIYKFMSNGDYNSLKQFTEYDLNDVPPNSDISLKQKLCYNCTNDETMMYIINNAIEDSPDNEGNTLLHYAGAYCNGTIFTLIVNKYSKDLYTKNNEGEVPIQMILRKSKEKYKQEKITCILNHGYDISQSIESCKIIIGANDKNLLMLVLERCTLEMLAQMETEILDSICRKYSSLDVYQTLHSKGINFNTDLNGTTALHLISSFCSNVEVFKFLVEEVKVDIKVRDSNRWLPLHCACYKSNYEVIEFMISKYDFEDKCSPVKLRDDDNDYHLIHLIDNNGKLNRNNRENAMMILFG